jgi:macrolide transport system ATP-binding/permease protein
MRSARPGYCATPISAGRSAGSPSVSAAASLSPAFCAGDRRCSCYDEPTNHLSLTLVDELNDALLDTPAAIVLVTHDRTLRSATRGPGYAKCTTLARPATRQ